ncbi:mRNA decapping domain containing protein [Babesia bovis T2Bo]|uniref:Hydrolase, NUDIX family protein n=1 Tax=Babesia bovis TaxID=5865 RepID=A7AMY8_BABBO|nr:mRNA decapping domain containing protein [Babesia bovis T2Bo]EDO07922.1 mRNA decapping domain containing protein [Babesia bovis T2Bo]|eukprot:XP_001611490.1 hydrolase, NUDIX family protein [Babesia bovis T2Bo]
MSSDPSVSGVLGKDSSSSALRAHLKRALGLDKGRTEVSQHETDIVHQGSPSHVMNAGLPPPSPRSSATVAGDAVSSLSHPDVSSMSKHSYEDDDSDDYMDVSLSRAKYLNANKDVNPDILDQALSDCYGRFVALLPEEVLRDHVHLCFYLRDAYWWYCDKWVVRYPLDLKSMSFGQFLSLVCQDCALLRSFVSAEDQKSLLARWKLYNRSIPLRGGVLINESCDKVLLVQGYQNNRWTFPRGKIDEGELDSSCAVREILEEVGIDVSGLINPDIYVESEIEGRNVKLFFIPGVSDSIDMQPKTDYEIRSIGWFSFKLFQDSPTRRNSGCLTFHVKQFTRDIIDLIERFRAGKLREQFPVAYETFLRTGGNCPNRMLPILWNDSASKSESTLRYNEDDCLVTFGENSGWSADEMFRVNREKFGVESTYTGQSPDGSTALKRERELIPFDLE